MAGAGSYYPSRFGRGVPALTTPGLNAGLGGSQPMMGTTPRYNIRKNMTRDPWDFTGDRMVQGGVDVNFAVNRDLIKARQGNMNQDGIRTLGSVLNPDVLQIMEGNLILIPRKAQNKVGAAMSTSKNPIFATASLTGVLTNPSTFPNQEQFEAGWYLVGKSKISYHFGEPAQSQTGVSVQTGGATTIANIGVTTFAFGDRIRWRLPNINDEIRRQQMQVIRTPKDHPPMKYVPILERATYEQQFRLTQTALDNYVRQYHLEGTAESRKAYLTRSAQDVIVDATSTTLDQHFQSECNNSTAVDAWVILSTFLEYGLITLNFPTDVNDAEVRNLARFQDIGLAELKSTTYGPAQNGAPVPNGGPRSTTWEQTKMLAHALGIVPHVNVPPLTSLLDALILRKYAGLLDSENSRKLRKDAALVNIAEANTATTMLEGTGSNPVERSLHLAQMNGAREADAQFYHAYRHATEQTFATSLSVTSDAGAKLDILF